MEHFPETGERRRVRSLFISDLHLGSRFAQAEAFLAFLEAYQPEYLYLVGDFIDGWSLRRSWRWHPAYTRILHQLFEWAQSGVTIRYTPGNHDGFLRDFLRDFIWVEVADEFIHQAADGRRYAVLHGDQFDHVESHAVWLSKLGSLGYEWLLCADRAIDAVRRRLGWQPWRLSASIKRRVKRIVSFVSGFGERVAEHARRNRCQGVICGHIHTPVIDTRGAVTYCNTGDWVENCSALLEFDDGELRLVRFCLGTGTIAQERAGVSPAGAAGRAQSTAPTMDAPA